MGMGMDSATADHFDRFDASELEHITGAGSSAAMIDWDKEEHRRCVVACLVKGTYVLESDRVRHRTGAAELAPAWWETFHFSLKKKLVEDALFTRTIFGAVFEYMPAHPSASAPRYVVAFRGTTPKNQARMVRFRDFYHDWKVVMNKLEKRTRSHIPCGVVDELMREQDQASQGQDGRIWLAGHSLGASVALVVGRYMMEQEKPLNLPTFLFNPPHVAFITSIKLLNVEPVAERHLHFVSYFFNAGEGFLGPHGKRMKELFERLSPWVPNLYVHEEDWICKGFIAYFEHREEFKKSFPRLGIWSMGISHRDWLFSLVGKKKEQLHLVPSATLWKSRLQPKYTHHLSQWWKPDGGLSLGAATSYSYPVHQA